MIKFLFKLKTIFHVFNVFLIFLYIYAGSFLGCFIYSDCDFDPQITGNFFISPNFSISSNHFYLFIIFSILSIFAYKNDSRINILLLYLIFLSIFLEVLHLIIPVRAFELSDLCGNLFGVFIIILIYKILYKYGKSKK